MRFITKPFFFFLLVMSLAPAFAAGPRFARIFVGLNELSLSSRAVVEDGNVYATPDILNKLGVSCAVGDKRVSIASGNDATDLKLYKINGDKMLRVDEVANLVDIEYNWDDATSTLKLLARLKSVSFDNNVLTANMTIPCTVSDVNIWPNPWRTAIDISGAKLAAKDRAVTVSSSNISQVRLGQFDDSTVRIVADTSTKTTCKVLTKGPSTEIKISFGGGSGQGSGPATNTEQPKPVIVEPVTISSVTADSDGSSKVTVRISTSGTPTFKTSVLSSPTRIAVNVSNGTLKLDKKDLGIEKGFLKDINADQIDNSSQITLSLDRQVGFKTEVQKNDIVISMRPLDGSGGRLCEKTFVIDPGHGGVKPGAQSNGIIEKNVTLLIAQKLKSKLEEAGAKVIMTRTDDSDVALSDRPAVADKYNADFFVSVHCNAIAPGNTVSGIETLHSGSTCCLALANAVQNRVIQSTGMRDMKPKARPGLVVLKNANVPAILVECGFIDNPTDRAKLCDDAYRGKVADGIVAGLRDYIEGKTSEE